MLVLLEVCLILTSKNDLSSVFFPGACTGAAGVTDTTSARSDCKKRNESLKSNNGNSAI